MLIHPTKRNEILQITVMIDYNYNKKKEREIKKRKFLDSSQYIPN